MKTNSENGDKEQTENVLTINSTQRGDQTTPRHVESPTKDVTGLDV